MRIDLHAHSTASDGTDTPEQLMSAAVSAGLDVIALTDHDTTAGWQSALAQRPAHLTVVRGAEFSCVYRRADGVRVSVHLLGYLFDPDHPRLSGEQARLRQARLTRGQEITARLSAAGYPISWQQVVELADGGVVGRPHIARALVAGEVVPDVAAAFSGLLASDSAYYVPKPDTDVFTALALITEAGGVAAIAHPLAHRRGPVVDDEALSAFTEAGLVGLEVDHPDHGEPERAHLARLAADLELVALGSSDYHGGNKATPLGACTTPVAAYSLLVDRPTAMRPIGDR